MSAVLKEALQLQFWDAQTRIAQADAPVGRYRAWRKVLPSKAWPVKNPKFRAKVNNSLYNRSIKEVRSQYMQWAKDKGLKTITDWKHCGPAPGFAYTNLVDKDLYFAVTVEEDTCVT